MIISNSANLIEGEVKVKRLKPDTYEVHILKVDGQWHKLEDVNKQNAEILLATAPFRSRTNARVFCTRNRKELNVRSDLCLSSK